MESDGEGCIRIQAATNDASELRAVFGNNQANYVTELSNLE